MSNLTESLQKYTQILDKIIRYMAKGIKQISFNIYADSEEEAEKGRKAIIQFINIMGQHGAMVSGEKIHEAVSHIGDNPFIMSQIIKYFKK